LSQSKNVKTLVELVPVMIEEEFEEEEEEEEIGGGVNSPSL
jgi:hypothetical protein